MHAFANHITSTSQLVSLVNSNSSARFSPADEAILRQYLNDDCKSLYYSSLLSLCEAVSGFRNSACSWASVKMYYSTFYAARAALCSSGIGIIYINQSPKIIDLNAPASQVRKGAPNTHKQVLSLYNNPSRPLNQVIDLKDPIEWLMKIRERANYINCKFPDPTCVEPYWAKISGVYTNPAIDLCINDTSHAYTYTEDYGLIAFPLQFFKYNYNSSALPISPTADELSLCKKHLTTKCYKVLKKLI